MAVSLEVGSDTVCSNVFAEVSNGIQIVVRGTLSNFRAVSGTVADVLLVGAAQPTIMGAKGINTLSDATLPAPAGANLTDIEAASFTFSAGKSGYKIKGLTQTGVGAQTIAGDSHSFVGCFWTAPLTVIGIANKFGDCTFSGTVSSVGVHNSYNNSIFNISSATALDISGSFNKSVANRAGLSAGGGIGTINITGASTGSIVGDCHTDAAITNAGIGTALSNNVVY